MAELLSFDEKVAGLAEYYRTIQGLDPRDPEHEGVANPSIFYSGAGYPVSVNLARVKADVLFDIGNHGRREYAARGFFRRDLRDDTDQDLTERADLLAVVTSPLSVEARQERAEKIRTLLGSIVSGESVVVRPFAETPYSYPAQIGHIDTRKPIFAVLEGHVSRRTLHIQHSSSTFNHRQQGIDGALHIGLPQLFCDEGIIVQPKLAA